MPSATHDNLRSLAPKEQRKPGDRPKYAIVYEALQRSIRRGDYTPESKLPSEAELMEQFRVSRTTVIRALRDLQIAGLVRRHRGSGSYAAGANPVNLTPIGLILPDLESGSLFSTVQQILLSEAQTLGWQILIRKIAVGRSPESAAEILVDLHQGGIQGLFYLPLPVRPGSINFNDSVGRFCVDWKHPLVLLDRDIHLLHDRSRFDVVCSDNELGGFQIGRHLIRDCGCRRITFLYEGFEYSTMEARLEGIRSAVALSPKAQLKICAGDCDDQKFLTGILEEFHPDAIACVSDKSAAKVLRTLFKIGVDVPRQIKLTGFDDTSTASLLPVPLTTVRQSPETIAMQALNVMSQRLKNPGFSALTISIACELVVRESTGAATSGAEAGSVGATIRVDGRITPGRISSHHSI